MARKSFAILLCLVFLFTWSFTPDAFARERRGKDFDWTPTLVFVGVAAVVGIVILLSAGHQSQAEKPADTKKQSKADIATKEDLLAQNRQHDIPNDIEGATSSSFRF
jgi:hypothetical protein